MRATEPSPRLTPEDRERILGYIRNPEQMAFFHVVPAETGLSRTIWVSQNDQYPAVLVSPVEGRLVHPPEAVLVVGFDEVTPFPDVNEWLASNRHLLPALASQEIDVGHFYDGMRSIGARWSTCRDGLPVCLW